MLVTIAVILVVLWLLGFITKVTLGGFIHLLLLLAIVVVLIRVGPPLPFPLAFALASPLASALPFS